MVGNAFGVYEWYAGRSIIGKFHIENMRRKFIVEEN